MVKIFNHKDSTPTHINDLSENEEKYKPVVKRFSHVKPTKNLVSEDKFRQPQSEKQEKHIKSTNKKKPSVLFSNKIKSIKSDLIIVEEEFKNEVDRVCKQEFQDVNLNNGDYLIIINIYHSIVFNDPVFQIEFGNEESKKFQQLQGFLSDYAKLGKVDKILGLGQVIIKLSKSIDIDIFNPNRVGTKLSKIFGNHNQKIRKIKYEFDRVSDNIDERIDRVFDNLAEMRAHLEKFRYWSIELRNLNRNLLFKMVALILRIEREKNSNQQENINLSTSSINNDFDSIKRWERKIKTLLSLKQSIDLTFPQIDLYISNLLGSFEQLEKIKVDVIQVWKQQFLTVIAIDESSDSILYYELTDVQEQLIRNIEELR
ncbi:hypothetical protein ACRTEP_03280 [Vibrio diabolicus]|uniref:hypothetical protein n=1 Tax=Vibrio diabolicus TaxID=50719 RepID=UPI003D7DF1CF